MKQILLTVAACASAILLASCYGDDTNENLSEAEEITVEEIPSAMALTQDIDSLDITPFVVSNLDAEWEYSWDYYIETDNKKFYHLSDNKDLAEICHFSTGQYVLVFTARNTRTGVSKLSTVSLEVRSPYSVGWYVLKDDGVDTDFDLFQAENSGYIENSPASPSVENIARTRTGTPLSGKAVKLVINPNIRDGQNNKLLCLGLASEHGYRLYDVEDMSVFQDENSCSLAPDTHFDPEILYCGSYLFMVSNGLLYASSTHNTGYYSYPTYLNNDSEDYYLAPWLAATSWSYMFYDEKSESFMSSNSYASSLTTASGTAKDNRIAPVKTGLKCLYMGASSNKGYGIFENKTTGQREILSFNISSYPSPTISEMLDDNDKLKDADLVSIANDVRVFYFVDKATGDVWSHMVNTAGEERLEYDVPSDENVVFVRQVRHYSIDKINYMAVATVKGSGSNAQYAIRFFPLSAGHFSKLNYDLTLVGNGYPKDVNFLRNGAQRSLMFNYSGIYK